MALKENSFTKGGRNWKSVPDPSGSGNVGIYYEATPAEVERVKNKTYTTPQGNVSGQLYVAEFGEKQYVLHSSYVKQPNNSYTYLPNPPGQEVDNGNVDQFIEIEKDKSIKTQVTDTQSPNTSTIDENQPNVPGGSTPTNPNTPQEQEQEPKDTILKYPNDISDLQDRIKFQALTYTANRTFTPGPNPIFNLKPVQFDTVEEVVVLSIQSTISDQNSVGWEPDTMNPIEVALANLSSGAMKIGGFKINETAVNRNLKGIIDKAQDNSDAIRTYLVGQAIGVNNLQSRLLGQVLNPNLELLFTGPQLRPFNFSFKLSPRDKTEADKVKKIIRYFKKNMATKIDPSNIFLKTPNVFKIEYQYGSKAGEHPGLNLIKICALTNFSVDYTPLGTYMTYADGTMVSYNLSLQFQELTPVYDKDYDEFDYGDGTSIKNPTIGA